MASEAPPDAFLRFKDDSFPHPYLCGESVDLQCPGDPRTSDPEKCWFQITGFSFSLSGSASHSAAGGAGGAGGKTPAKGAGGGGGKGASPTAPASGAKEGEGVFKGVSITMPTQYGSMNLMKLCTDYARPPEDEEVPKVKEAYIYIRRPGYAEQDAAPGSGQSYFLAYYLYNVTIEDYSTNLNLEDTFVLNYEKMKNEYYFTEPDTGLMDWGCCASREWLNSDSSSGT
jgi:hypothetical protein